VRVFLVPVTPFQQNCAVLHCESTGQGAIVDPGGDLDAVLAVVEREGIDIVKILLTHGHLDHAGAAGELSKRLGLEIVGPHREDQWWLDCMAKQGEMFGVQGAQTCTPDLYLEEGDTVSVGEIELQVLHCPGHTPGHVAFFDPASKTAVVGDLLFCGSIGRSDFPRSDPAALIHSLKHKILPLGDDVTFHCGHGPSGNLGHERATNPFLQGSPKQY
jgi:hydroxyacylglutathione hydrolase